MHTTTEQLPREPKAISPKLKLSVFILVPLLLVIILVVNITIRSAFYSESLNFIIDYQTTSAKPSLTGFYNIISLLVNTIFVSVLLGLIYVFFPRKLSALVFISYFIFNTYMMTIMKSSFLEPRPFWYADDIMQLEWGCPKQFGNPSGHSWLVSLIYEPLITDFLGSGWYGLGYLFPIVAMVLVPISRMYLGAHSGNEVLMGLTMGISMCVLYRYFLQKRLYRLFSLMTGEADAVKKTYFARIMTALFSAITFVVPIVIYKITSIQRYIDQSQLDNIGLKCGITTPTFLQLLSSMMSSAALVQLIFGILFGMAFAHPDNHYYMAGKWTFTGTGVCQIILKNIYKILIEAGIAALPLLIIFLVPKFVHDPYVKYVVSSIGFWIIGFALMALSYRSFLRFGIAKNIDTNLQEVPEVSGQSKN